MLPPGQAQDGPEAFVGQCDLQSVVEGPEKGEASKQQQELQEETQRKLVDFTQRQADLILYASLSKH